jgi:hypothetical protein
MRISSVEEKRRHAAQSAHDPTVSLAAAPPSPTGHTTAIVVAVLVLLAPEFVGW